MNAIGFGSNLVHVGPLHFGKARLTRLLARIAKRTTEREHRNRILLQLRSLSSSELDDIGLDRGDLCRVFDPAFVLAVRS